MKAPFGMPHARTVLLILDMISDFDFPDGKAVLRSAHAIAPRIAALKARATKARIPTLYVNDNMGRWRSDINALVLQCARQDAPGHDVIQQIAPGEDDFVLLKPKHSGFYATPLPSYSKPRTRSASFSPGSRRINACCSPQTMPTCASSSS